MEEKTFEVIVVGGGHAGCEAAAAAARLGCRTLLTAIDLDHIAQMSCSPSIGGLGKSHLVKEVDALGGLMARAADLSAIQFHLLNTRKGPAVQATRTQNDRLLYQRTVRKFLEAVPGLTLRQTMIVGLSVSDGSVVGVEDYLGIKYRAQAVVLATGTFLHGLIHIGGMRRPAGRAGEAPAEELASDLAHLGFSLGRMKTGTPPRIMGDSVDFSRFRRQDSDPQPQALSYWHSPEFLPVRPCFFGHTNQRTHEIVRRHIGLSPLYSGAITGVSARYCPSLEDKVMKFAERPGHQVILEPEGLDTVELYASGLGNSLPVSIQEDIVHSVEGLENAVISRPAYAIEYDFVYPTQLLPTLESKMLAGLFLAGQINGTSGYEEAAGQGILAGANAALKVLKRPPFILDRSEAYIGVMVDDLVTRGTREPYRMFTARAEYRLLLREDNAHLRLLEKAFKLGLEQEARYRRLEELMQAVAKEKTRLKERMLPPLKAVNAQLAAWSSSPLTQSVSLEQLLKRPELDYARLRLLEGLSSLAPGPQADHEVGRQVEIECKYEGYLRRQESEVESFRQMERVKLPPDLDYNSIPGLSRELNLRLSGLRPLSLGQASRLEGMTPAALSAIMIYTKARGR